MRILPILLIAALGAGPALAQSLLRQADGLGLSNAEVDAITAAGQTLYAGPAIAEVGAVADWSVEGAKSGTVTLEAVETRPTDGATCVKLRQTARLDPMAEPRAVTLRRCRGADGVWRLAVE